MIISARIMNDSHTRSTERKVAKTGNQTSVAEQAWHVLSIEAVTEKLHTDVTRGLTQVEA